MNRSGFMIFFTKVRGEDKKLHGYTAELSSSKSAMRPFICVKAFSAAVRVCFTMD